MKNFEKLLAIGFFAISTGMVSIAAQAETTAGEKVQEGAEDAGKNVKKGYRNVKDKACEMVNGKLECVGKKAMNKARNAKDEINDKADDVQKKVD